MAESEAFTAVLRALRAHGCLLSVSEYDLDLVSAGVNSAALIQILSALEDEFEVEFEVESLFGGPVTATRLEAEITHALGRCTPQRDETAHV